MNAVASGPLSELAALLAYPKEGTAARARAAQSALAAAAPEAARVLDSFAAFAEVNADTRLEEVFAEVFDFNPACAPEIGWHLYGEDYKRGAFLVRMRELMRGYGIPEDSELPDHLVHVLEVYSRLEPAQARMLAERNILPALEKMRKACAGNPYEAVLAAVEAFLKGANR